MADSSMHLFRDRHLYCGETIMNSCVEHGRAGVFPEETDARLNWIPGRRHRFRVHDNEISPAVTFLAKNNTHFKFLHGVKNGILGDPRFNRAKSATILL